jgi:predicted RNA-binding protein with RPS1 domain
MRSSRCRPSPTFLAELEKPGRDPRPAFKTASFREGVEKLDDLRPGMVLEGVVTNVATFGAFVDVGVHQDGLVHISAMANAYVKDPRTIAKPGDVVRVKVLEVDSRRRRISLTMRLDQALEARSAAARAEIAGAESEKRSRPAETRPGRGNPEPTSGDAIAEAFRRAGLARQTPGRGFVTVTGVRTEGALGLIKSHAAATASDHCAAASALKIRKVDRETRWRWRLKVLWTAACMLRKR